MTDWNMEIEFNITAFPLPDLTLYRDGRPTSRRLLVDHDVAERPNVFTGVIHVPGKAQRHVTADYAQHATSVFTLVATNSMGSHNKTAVVANGETSLPGGRARNIESLSYLRVWAVIQLMVKTCSSS